MNWPKGMNSILQGKIERTSVPTQTNYTQHGEGAPVILIHGLAASLHDWDILAPDLAEAGYAAYALDLLGHGESAKPQARTYRIEWMIEHLEHWIDSLNLSQPLVLVSHSLGGYLSLAYAQRHPERTRAQVLVDPFYSVDQLPSLLRLTYRKPVVRTAVIEHTPEWLFRVLVDMSSISLGRSGGSLYSLSEEVRAQTALDYKRTAPGAFSLPGNCPDLTPSLSQVEIPTLVVWGEHDQTLAPKSFEKLVRALPQATSHTFPGGHVPHQVYPERFNRLMLEFLAGL